jgi:hypothetical protein
LHAWFLVFFDGTIALYDMEVSVVAAQWLDLLASLLVDGTQFTAWPWMDGWTRLCSMAVAGNSGGGEVVE